MSGGVRSLFAFWQGGYGEGEIRYGVRSLFAVWQGGYGKRQAVSGSISASLDATEIADSLESTATVSSRRPVSGGGFLRPRLRQRPLEPIIAHLDALERPDTLESEVTLGLNPVEMDNNLLLMAA